MNSTTGRSDGSRAELPAGLGATGVLLGRAAILALGLGLMSIHLTKEFSGWHEWNSAWYSFFGRNHIQYGLGYTKLLCTYGLSAQPPVVPTHYLNHPPLIAAWAALPMLVFGDHEWAIRLVPIACTLASAWLVMVIAGRGMGRDERGPQGGPYRCSGGAGMVRTADPTDVGTQGAAYALLAGLFYVTFPITAYFGRMLDHVPVVQFFSLLTLHGYLQWAGLYGPGYRRSVGAVWYVVGVVLGTGTGWANVIMAGLIWWWHVLRSVRRGQADWMLVWLTVVPAASLAAVILHIAWARAWDMSLFWPLLTQRSVGQRPEGPQPWSDWAMRQWEFLRLNYSVVGIGAVVVWAGIVVGARWVGARETGEAGLRTRPTGVAMALTGLHGLIYVVMFKNQSWIHEYWQFFAAPFVATAMAGAVVAAYTLVRRISVPGAWVVGVVLVLLPMPAFGKSLYTYHSRQHIPPDFLEVFEKLNELIPPKAPVMTWSNWTNPAKFRETFGTYVHQYGQPQILYYANRPLIYTQKPADILANREGCAAYVFDFMDHPKAYKMAEFLRQHYETVAVGNDRHLIALLNRARGRAATQP